MPENEAKTILLVCVGFLRVALSVCVCVSVCVLTAASLGAFSVEHADFLCVNKTVGFLKIQGQP